MKDREGDKKKGGGTRAYLIDDFELDVVEGALAHVEGRRVLLRVCLAKNVQMRGMGVDEGLVGRVR